MGVGFTALWGADVEGSHLGNDRPDPLSSTGILIKGSLCRGGMRLFPAEISTLTILVVLIVSLIKPS